MFIGAPGEAKDLVRALVKALNHRGISAHDEPAAGGVQLEALSRSRHFVGVFGPREGPRDALEQFLKQAIEDRSDRTPIPILLEGMKTDDLPALLRGYKTATLTATSIETVAAHIQGVVNPEGLHSPSGLGMSGPAPAPRSRMSLWLDDIAPPVALTVGIAVLALIAWGLGSLAGRFLPSTWARIETLDRWQSTLGSLGAVTLFTLLWASISLSALGIYRFADAVWRTPLIGDEHVVPFVLSLTIGTLLFIIAFGTGPMLVGALLFGGAFAYLMYKALD